jgi:hypothetical protein
MLRKVSDAMTQHWGVELSALLYSPRSLVAKWSLRLRLRVD